MVTDKVTVYVYEVVDGDNKGKTVKSFDNAVFDAKHGIVMHSNMPIACFDDSGAEYVLFVGELKQIGEYQMAIPDELKQQYHDMTFLW